MDQKDLLIELFGRIDGHLDAVLADLTVDDLSWQPTHRDGATGANPIGWLIWHIGRVIDAQIADVAGTEQVWTTGAWARGFGLEPDPHDTGYGHSPADVAAVRPRDVAVVGAYFTRVSEAARDRLERLDADDLARVVDASWDPPVTLAVRLISIADDAIQHAGQAAYVKGLLGR